MKINPEMFRNYDIRGIYGSDLTDEVVLAMGKGMGSFFRQNGLRRVFVGRDNRVSGVRLKEILIESLISTGCDVVDLGLILNPMMYFSWYHLDAKACVIVTASHNPARYNGFKMSMNKTPLSAEDYQEILRLSENGVFFEGTGLKEEVTVWPAYKGKIKEDIRLSRKMKVVIDCGNGTAGLFAPELLREIGCEVTELYCESDGTFPNHDPYPQKVESYTKLKETILAKKADFGLAFDGDGDRLGIYDELSNFVENDRLAMLFARDICPKNPGSKVVMNISTSLSVKEYIESCGGELILWKTGYTNIARKMKETNSIFGGEISGHYFFRDRYFGYDDALYSAFRAFEIISREKETLSQITSKLPQYFETRELRIEVPEGKDKFAITQKVAQEIKKDHPDCAVLEIDGLRFSFPDGWGLIRPSNTESVIGVRAEAKSGPRLEEIKAIIGQKLEANDIKFFWK